MLTFFSRLKKPEDFSSRTVLTFKLDIYTPFMACVFVVIAIKSMETGAEYCANPETPTKPALGNFHLNQKDGQSVSREGLVMVKNKG